MAKEMLTAGIWIGYAAEATAGTRPTTATAYTKIPSVTDIGELDDDPETKEVTDLSDYARRYIKGLEGGGNGILTLTGNKTEDFMTAWDTMMAAYKTAADAGKAMWYCIGFPGAAKAYYIAGEPVRLGLSAIAVDEVQSIRGKIVVNDDHGYDTAPTT